MTYLAKAALFCDHCGARAECDPSPNPPLFSSFTEGKPYDGWMPIDDKHHLCARCAEEYRRKEKEMKSELKKFAGIKEISFDL